jgi:hypothetical protein
MERNAGLITKALATADCKTVRRLNTEDAEGTGVEIKSVIRLTP